MDDDGLSPEPGSLKPVTSKRIVHRKSSTEQKFPGVFTRMQTGRVGQRVGRGRKERGGSFQNNVLGRNSRRSFVSHALSDYSECFRSYTTADVLIVDQGASSREATRSRVSMIIIKGSSACTPGTSSRLVVDEGRNATVNVCATHKQAMDRLIMKGERYALVIVKDTSFAADAENDNSLVRDLREAGYDNAIAMLFNTCTFAHASKARDHGADSCLVANTGSLGVELNRLLCALSIRSPIHPMQRAASTKEIHNGVSRIPLSRMSTVA